MKKIRNWRCCFNNSFPNLLLKMKLLTFLILVSVASVTATSYSQETKFDMDLANITVRQVFQEIEDNSKFIFLYSEKSVDVNRRVSVKVKNETVSSILDQVFKGTSDFYEIHDRQIAIMSKDNSNTTFVSSRLNVLTQGREISGKVTDSSGAPLPGVTIVVKGTSQGIITDFDGNYTLLNVPADATLQFSFLCPGKRILM